MDSCANGGFCGRTIGRVPICRILLAVFFVLLAVAASRGQTVQQNPAFKDSIDVIEHLGDTLDVSLPLIDADGDTVTLGSQLTGDRPAVLVFHYSDCPMLCSLVLNGVSAATRAVDLVPGEDYTIISVSVNPCETPQRSAASEKRYNGELPESATGRPWRFYTATQPALAALTRQAGFKYYYDADKDQYMHPAVVTLLTPAGVIARYLYGIEYKPRDFRLGIVEASDGEVGSTADRVLLYCMQYDPDAEGYVMFAANVMKLGGVVTMLFLAVLLGGLWLKERVRRRGAGG